MNIRSCCGRIVAAALCSAFATSSWRAEALADSGAPFDRDPAALMRRAEAATRDSKADAIVVSRRVEYRFDAAGRQTTRRHNIYRILTPSGVTQFNETPPTYWNPLHQDRPVVAARVTTADGRSFVLDPKTAGDVPASTDPRVRSAVRELRAPLPGVSIGAVVELVSTVADRAPSFAAGAVTTHFFVGRFPILEQRLVVIAPEKLLRIQPRGLSAQAFATFKISMKTTGGVSHHAWDVGPLPAWVPPIPNAPPDAVIEPYVAFTTGRAWTEVADSYAAIVDAAIAKDDLRATVAETVRGAKGVQAEIVSRLLARVRREVRYSAALFGRSPIVPHSPQTVLARRYGDCKDQATLLVALLRTAGVPAYVALIRNGPGRDIERDLPGLGGFDHVIVYLPATNSFVDPTLPFFPPGRLPSAEQGRAALIVEPKKGRLVTTPRDEPKDNRIIVHHRVQLAEWGLGSDDVSFEFSGTAAGWSRNVYSSPDVEERQRKQFLEDKVATSISRFTLTNLNELDRVFHLAYRLEGVTYADSDGKSVSVNLAPIEVLGFLAPELRRRASEVRTVDYLVDDPATVEARYTIEAPPGFVVASVPEAETVALGPMRLEKKFDVATPGRVVAVFRLDMVKNRLTPKEVVAVQEAVAAINEAPGPKVTFESHGEKYLAAGNIEAALAEFRRLAKLHPKEAGHFVQTSRALLRAGFRDAAIAEANKAIAVEPGSNLGAWQLGHLLLHDPLGRHLKGQFDYAGADTAYRKALAIKSEPALLGIFASVMARNKDGVPGGEGARLGEAIAIFEKLRAEGVRDFDDELLECLFHAERHRDAITHARRLEVNAWRGTYLLSAIAITGGAKAAIDEAGRRFPDLSSRREVLKATVIRLMRKAKYEVAAEILEAATEGDTAAAAAKPIIDALRKGPFAVRSDVTKAPVPFVQQSIVNFLAGKEPNLADFVDFDPEAYRRTASPLKAALAAIPVPGAVLLHLLSFEKEGSAEVGYRVRMQFLGGGGLGSFFVTAEKNRLKFPGLESSGVANEAWRRVEKGDLDGARQWLDWLADEGEPGGSADDRFSGNLFFRVWKRGAAASTAETRIAAAVALSYVGSKRIGRTVATLEACAADVANETTRAACGFALASVLGQLGQPAKALLVVEKLLPIDSTSRALFHLKAGLLQDIGRLDEVVKLSRERLTQFPKERLALDMLAFASASVARFGDAKAALQSILDADGNDTNAMRDLAWLHLVAGSVDARAVDLARRAVTGTSRNAPPALGTLAALVAEAGGVAEARDLVVERMDLDGRSEPDENEWYVIGRIAERLGMEPEATRAYAKIARPKKVGDLAQSSFRLAEQRRKRLAAPRAQAN